MEEQGWLRMEKTRITNDEMHKKRHSSFHPLASFGGWKENEFVLNLL